MVTGGAGFIGSHLVDMIIQEKPSNLVVVDNLFLGKESNLQEARRNYPNLKLIIQDATKYKAMQSIIEKEDIEVVFNLAIVPLPVSLTKPLWAYKQNINLTVCLCELIRKRYFKSLVHFSSSEAYGSSLYIPMNEEHPLNPTTSYGVSKASADLLVLSYYHSFDINAVIIRPFNNYGPRQNEGNHAGIIPLTIKRILSGKAPVIYGDGKQTRDFTYVADTARVTVEIYNHLYRNTKGKVINIGSGNEIQINQLVRMIATCMNYNGDTIYQAERVGDVKRHIADTSLAQKLIYYSPLWTLERGLKTTIEEVSKC